MDDNSVPREHFVKTVSVIGELLFRKVALEAMVEKQRETILRLSHEIETLEARVLTPRR